MQYARILLILILSGVGFSSTLFGQDLTWQELAEIQYSKRFDEEQQLTIKVPQFNKSIQKLEGKTVELSGYLIPVDATSNYYVLSANPFSSCYFCGNAGPETVVELRLSGEFSSLRMDQWVTVEGTLTLNDSDMYQLPYILDAATITDVE